MLVKVKEEMLRL